MRLSHLYKGHCKCCSFGYPDIIHSHETLPLALLALITQSLLKRNCQIRLLHSSHSNMTKCGKYLYSHELEPD